MSWTEFLMGVFFPVRCLTCGRTAEPGKVFCKSCEEKAPGVHYRNRYQLPWTEEPLFVLAALPYTGEFREAVLRFKFHGQRALAKPFGRLMARTAEIDGVPFDAVVWAPMTAARKRERGYDQSELLAKAVAKELHIPCLPALEKTRETKTQHELSAAERRENVEGAYKAWQKGPDEAGSLTGKRVLLVDDIVTTGATMKECAGVLYAAGAGEVVGLCAANAPLGGTV